MPGNSFSNYKFLAEIRISSFPEVDFWKADSYQMLKPDFPGNSEINCFWHKNAKKLCQTLNSSSQSFQCQSISSEGDSPAGA